MACLKRDFDFFALTRAYEFNLYLISRILCGELLEQFFPSEHFLSIKLCHHVVRLQARFLSGAFGKNRDDLQTFVGIFSKCTEETESAHRATPAGIPTAIPTASNEGVLKRHRFRTSFNGCFKRIAGFLIPYRIEDSVEVADRFVVDRLDDVTHLEPRFLSWAVRVHLRNHYGVFTILTDCTPKHR